MKITTTYERLMPTTADGHIIKVTTYYSSFDKDEIDKVQEVLRKSIGAGLIGDTSLDLDAIEASIPYSYNAPEHDWKCGYPTDTRGEKK